jgi:hypothetical protein
MANDQVLSAAAWRKSSRSGAGSSNCVEIAVLSDDQVGLRDSKAEPGGPVLTVSRRTFQDFIHAARSGLFDRTIVRS